MFAQKLEHNLYHYATSFISQVHPLFNRESLKGGKLGEKVVFCLPTAGGRKQLIHLTFTQPGVHLLEIPCISFLKFFPLRNDWTRVQILVKHKQHRTSQSQNHPCSPTAPGIRQTLSLLILNIDNQRRFFGRLPQAWYQVATTCAPLSESSWPFLSCLVGRSTTRQEDSRPTFELMPKGAPVEEPFRVSLYSLS